MSTREKRAAAKRISVRDANQGFSKLIARVERGEKFIVTKNKREVARIEPMGVDNVEAARRRAAWARIEQFMCADRRSIDGWTYKSRREELHDRSV